MNLFILYRDELLLTFYLSEFFKTIFEAQNWNGEYLNITQVNRDDMGAYLCIATNGVLPAVSKRIVLNVNCKYSARNTFKCFEKNSHFISILFCLFCL